MREFSTDMRYCLFLIHNGYDFVLNDLYALGTSVRGEDVKLTSEQSVGWQSCVIDENGKEIEVTDSSWDVMERPDYMELQDKINEIIPEPLWMRKMQEVSDKGLKFQRKE